MTHHYQALPGIEEPGSYRAADHTARTQVCAECGAALGVFFDHAAAEGQRWVARCYAALDGHQGTKPRPTTKEMIAEKLAEVARGNAAAKAQGRSPEERAGVRRAMWEE